MSRVDVELVRQFQAPPDMDLAKVFRRELPDDDPVMAASDAVVERCLSTDVVCVFHKVSAEPRHGIAEWREAWLDWLAPWETYRAEIKEIRDLGDRVAVFVRDYGRPHGAADEVAFSGVAVYTVRDQKIVRVEHFTDPSRAAEVLGLQD